MSHHEYPVNRYVYCRHCQRRYHLAEFVYETHPVGSGKFFFTLCQICVEINPVFHSLNFEYDSGGGVGAIHRLWINSRGETYEYYRFQDDRRPISVKNGEEDSEH